MAKIMILSDGYGVPSGFGGQATIFADWMRAKGHDVFYIGLGQGPTETTKNGIVKLPCGDTKFGETVLNDYLKKYKPDILWSLLDVPMVQWITAGGVKIEHSEYPLDLGRTKWITYFPVDSEDFMPADYVNIVKKFQYPVCFAKNTVKLIERDCGFTPTYIPHCINTDIFKPYDEATLKKFKDAQQSNTKDCFIIGMNGNNQLRKMQPYLLEAYSKFMKPDTRLALHMDLLNSRGLWNANGWNLAAISENLKIPANHIIKTDAGKGFSGKFNVSAENINSFYNLCDVHYNCGNEGFGIPFIESMSAGIPNISVHYTTAEEFIGNNERGRLSEIGNFWYHQDAGVRWAMPDVDSLVEQMEWCYEHREELKELGKKAREFVVANYDIKKVMPIWEKYIDEVLKDESTQVDYITGVLGI